jgi:hypothetical protein
MEKLKSSFQFIVLCSLIAQPTLAAQGAAPRLGPVVTKAQATAAGHLQYCLVDFPDFCAMIQDDAIAYCDRPQANEHLPSAREFALYAKAQGARGILANEDGSGNWVYTQHDQPFYFTSEGYRKPSQRELTSWFWTSSIRVDNSQAGYVFYGGYGSIGAEGWARMGIHLVRCAMGKQSP